MPEIGEMLREARMRAGIDVSEIEARTKIRAKYLRALENEEWDLLPGPTFVKSFLRTYAEALGLDAKLLVEEYKLRHERLSDVEMQPILPSSGGPQRRRPGVDVPRSWLLGAGALGFAALLLVLGLTSSGSGTHHTTTGTPPPPGLNHGRRPGHRPVPAQNPPRPQTVTLQILPTASVYVCLQTGKGHRLINGLILSPGKRQQTYHSRVFRVTLGNRSVRLRINGHTLSVPAGSNPIGYTITTRGRHVLPAGRRPLCL
jgi:transcriptional regulator with XRE-family HTH domain